MKYINADRLREKIIDRLDLFKELSSDTISPIRIDECKQIIDIIDSFQQEPQEVDLEKEMEKWRHTHFNGERDGHYSGEYLTRESQLDMSRYFYELGQRRAAEMYDEVEYNRQRADEEMSDKTLDEAADNFVWEVMENDEEGISDLCQKLRPSSKISDFYDALGEFFKAGAKWMAGQGEVQEHFVIGHTEESQGHSVIVCYPESFGIGDKVIVQIRKKEESK